MAVHQWIRINIKTVNGTVTCTVDPDTLIAVRSVGDRDDFVHWVLQSPEEFTFNSANGIVMGSKADGVKWNDVSTSRPIQAPGGGVAVQGVHWVMGFRNQAGNQPPVGHYKYTITVTGPDRVDHSFDPELEIDQEA